MRKPSTVFAYGDATNFYPWRFLGLAFAIVAWIDCTHTTNIFPNGAVGSEISWAFFYPYHLGGIVVLAVYATLSRRVKISDHPGLCFASAALTSLCYIVLGYSIVPGSLPLIVVSILSFAAAFGTFTGLCLWAETYSGLQPSKVIVYGSLSCLLAFAVAMLTSVVMEPWRVLFVAAYPVLSVVFGVMSVGAANSLKPAQVELAAAGMRVPWKIIALLLLGVLVSSCVGPYFASSATEGATHRIVAQGLVGLVIFGLVLFRQDKVDIRILAKLVLPIAVATFLLIPFFGSTAGNVISLMVKVSCIWLLFFVLSLLASISYRFEIPSLQLFPIVALLCTLTMVLGNAARALIQDVLVVPETVTLPGYAVVGLLIVVISLLLWNKEEGVNGNWYVIGALMENSVDVPGMRDVVAARSKATAEHYGLTARECEVLELLAQGRSAVEVQEQLVLSPNTVKTHIRNIYGKLDVHSKKDACEIFWG